MSAAEGCGRGAERRGAPGFPALRPSPACRVSFTRTRTVSFVCFMFFVFFVCASDCSCDGLYPGRFTATRCPPCSITTRRVFRYAVRISFSRSMIRSRIRSVGVFAVSFFSFACVSFSRRLTIRSTSRSKWISGGAACAALSSSRYASCIGRQEPIPCPFRRTSCAVNICVNNPNGDRVSCLASVISCFVTAMESIRNTRCESARCGSPQARADYCSDPDRHIS